MRILWLEFKNFIIINYSFFVFSYYYLFKLI